MRRSWLDAVLGHFADTSEEGRVFDETWGTRTRSFDLGNYEPTLPSVVHAALRAVGLGPEDATFVDLGSGKGRVALLASQLPYRSVVGIEHRRRLHGLAQENLAAFTARGGPRCEVHLLCADAASLPMPEGPLVLFLFNAFPPDVLRPVLDGVYEREAVRLIYVNPKYDQVLRAWGWHCMKCDDSNGDPSWEWRIYAPAAACGGPA